MLSVFDPTTATNAELDQRIVERERREGLPAHEKFGISGADLMAMEFADTRYVVERLIATGLTILAGAPKVRKSWLSLDVAIAVGGGTDALTGLPCDHGDVLVLALEDNPKRLQKRLKKMGVNPSPKRITFCTEWPSGAEAVSAIEAWARSAQNPKLVVVDVFACIRPQTARDVSYQDDYNSLKALQQLANVLEIAIIAIHHTRKMSADDPLNEVSGTTGLNGAADTTLVLRRDNTGTGGCKATLLGRGRDLEDDVELALQFDNDTCRWKVLGEAHAVANTAEQQAILDVLSGSGQPMRLSEIAQAVGKTRPNVGLMLGKLVKDGLVGKPATGTYEVLKTLNALNTPPSPLSELSELSAPQHGRRHCPKCVGEGCLYCGGRGYFSVSRQ